MFKSLRLVYDQRVVLESFTTVPYGSKDVIRIDGKTKEYNFMLNDFPAPVSLDGKIYKSAEAYMLCKRLDPEYQNRLFNHDDLCNQIRAAPTVQDAQQIANRPNAFRQDWATLQYFFGLKVVNAKFKDNEGLKHSLVATGSWCTKTAIHSGGPDLTDKARTSSARCWRMSGSE